jgi:hypothetical protein
MDLKIGSKDVFKVEEMESWANSQWGQWQALPDCVAQHEKNE